MSKVVGVLGGRDFSPGIVSAWLNWAEHIYAADSGADTCLAAGFRPIVTGDLDSFKGDLSGLDVRHDPDQETSDADKLLAQITADGWHSAVLLCAEGDRLDHVLATLASCARSELDLTLALRRGLATIVRQGHSQAYVHPPGTRFSILPLFDTVVSTDGAKWDVACQIMGGPHGLSLSNRFESDTLHVDIHKGQALLVLEIEPKPKSYQA